MWQRQVVGWLTWNAMGFWTLKAHPPVTHLLQQDHAFGSFPNSSTNWRSSGQIGKPMGALLVQTTIWSFSLGQKFMTSVGLIGQGALGMYLPPTPSAGRVTGPQSHAAIFMYVLLIWHQGLMCVGKLSHDWNISPAPGYRTWKLFSITLSKLDLVFPCLYLLNCLLSYGDVT